MPKLVNKLPKYSHHKATGPGQGSPPGEGHYLGKYGTDEAWSATWRSAPTCRSRRLSQPRAGANPGRCLARAGGRVTTLLARQVVLRSHRQADRRTFNDPRGSPSAQGTLRRPTRQRLRPEEVDQASDDRDRVVEAVHQQGDQHRPAL